MKFRPFLKAGALVGALLAVLALASCGRDRGGQSRGSKADGFMPASHDPERLAQVSPARCLPCHEEAVEDWRRSHHALANRPFSVALDAARFDHPVDPASSPYRPDGRTFRVEGPGLAEAPLGGSRGVIGITPLIQDLVAQGGGRWQAHELAYDPHEEEWFNIFNDEQRQPGEWGHWSGQGMNWNSNCAWCHMTEYKRNYDAETDSYDSTWLAHGLSCVQCHPRSLEHTEAAEAGKYLPADLRVNAPAVAMHTCASCHSRREALTDDAFVAGDDFHDHYRLTLPDALDIYFHDGQNRDENYVFGSLMLSGMGHAGVTCMDCHNPHSGEMILPVDNNSLCMRCHGSGLEDAPVVDPVAHSHHPATSTGNRCVECHMPHRTYMGRDPRRDHGFTSPDPELSMEIGSPDACVRCHQDQPVEWSIEHANKWYDSPQREERRIRARLLARAHSGETSFPTRELQAAADATPQVYWKAAYIRLLVGSPEVASLRAWAETQSLHEHTVVRGAAIRLLGASGASAPEMEAFLQDPARQVELEARSVLRRRGALPPTPEGAEAEYFAANDDRPGIALQQAALALARDELAKAVQHLGRAASFDRSNAALYFEAALLLAQAGHPDHALDFLRRAPEIARASGLVYYAEGLLWAEKGDVGRAADRLRLAVERDSSQARWHYNLALAHMRLSNFDAARLALEQALTLEPQNPAYLQLAAQLRQPPAS